MNMLKALFSPPVAVTCEEQACQERVETLPIEPLWSTQVTMIATVTETIVPGALGHVKFRGTQWRAQSDRPLILEAGTKVRVIGRHHSTILMVRP